MCSWYNQNSTEKWEAAATDCLWILYDRTEYYVYRRYRRCKTLAGQTSWKNPKCSVIGSFSVAASGADGWKWCSVFVTFWERDGKYGGHPAPWYTKRFLSLTYKDEAEIIRAECLLWAVDRYWGFDSVIWWIAVDKKYRAMGQICTPDWATAESCASSSGEYSSAERTLSVTAGCPAK